MSDAIAAMWDGEHFAPLGRFRKLCDQDFVVGQVYTLEAILERSGNTHRHFFARVHDLWLTLPEGVAERFKSSEHLRKWALIKAGYADQRSIVCADEFEAQKVAAFVEPIDTYAIVAVTQNIVTIYTAQSQALKAMDAKRFQQSKTAVLDIISELLGVTRKEAERATA